LGDVSEIVAASEMTRARIQVPAFLQGATEDDFQERVIAEAEDHGWRVYFVPDWVWRIVYRAVRARGYPGRRWAKSGFPDLVMVRRGRLLFAELKSESGSVKVAQDGWLTDLEAVPGVGVYVWRPRDWAEIAAVLG
jgi:hypothetical protein